MTFNPMAGIAVAHLRKFLADDPTVCELGNQRMTVTPEIMADLGITANTTEGFYKALGFAGHVAIDVNTKFGSEVMDLNVDLRQRYGYRNRFDLVTNNGTGEHIFNQCAVFKNVHQLCVPGGVMLHVLPMLPWVNHGFFNYNPILFRDLGLANGYDTLILWIGDRWGNRADLTKEDWVFREKHPKELNAVLREFKNDVMIVCAFRKLHDVAFKIPMQGKYVGDIEGDDLRARYA